MFTPSLASASLRPILLPPTLQPNAIAFMAPPTSRGLSALLACGFYSLLGGGGALAAHFMPARALELPKGSTERPPIILELAKLLVQENRIVSSPQTMGHETPARNQELEALPKPPESEIPSEPPSRLPTNPQTGTGTSETVLPVGTTGVRGGYKDLPIGPSDSGSIKSVEITTAQVHILSQVQPVYPMLARMTRIQGPVVLQMTIDTRGIPTDVQVASGHPALQAEAVRAARLWRFVAATVNGHTVPATFQLSIIFSLR